MPRSRQPLESADSYFPLLQATLSASSSSTNPDREVPFAQTLYRSRFKDIQAYARQHPRTTRHASSDASLGTIVPEEVLTGYRKVFLSRAYDAASSRRWSSLHAEVYADGALINHLWGENALNLPELEGRTWTLEQLLHILGFASADLLAHQMIKFAYVPPMPIVTRPMISRLLWSNLPWGVSNPAGVLSPDIVQETKIKLGRMTMQQQVDWLANNVGAPALDYKPASHARTDVEHGGENNGL